MKLEFSQQTFEKVYTTDLFKIRPMGAELFHTDRHVEAISRLKSVIDLWQRDLNPPNNFGIETFERGERWEGKEGCANTVSALLCHFHAHHSNQPVKAGRLRMIQTEY